MQTMKCCYTPPWMAKVGRNRKCWPGGMVTCQWECNWQSLVRSSIMSSHSVIPNCSWPMDCARQSSLSSTNSQSCSNSCPLSRWCHPTISSTVAPFSSCPQSFPTSGSFPVSQLFVLGDQSTGASASASVLPMTIQSWVPLGLIGLTSLLSKGFKGSSPRGFPGSSGGKESACNAVDPGSNPGSGRFPGEGIGNPLQYSGLENSIDRGAWQATVQGVAKSQTWLSNLHFHFLQHYNSEASVLQHSAFFMVQLSHLYMPTGKTIALTIWTFVSKVMSLLLNVLSRFVRAFLPRSKNLLILWLQSRSTVILERKKVKSITVSIFFPSICHEVMGPHAMILVFES